MHSITSMTYAVTGPRVLVFALCAGFFALPSTPSRSAASSNPPVQHRGAASFQPLGDLPGGEFGSLANAVSRDGSTVVGVSKSAASGFDWEAFRWTEAGGLIGLGGLGSGPVDSNARDVSFDGSVVVGSSNGQPFRWTEATGLDSLLSSKDEFLHGQAFGISADGSVVVGVAASLEGNQAVRWTEATGMVGLGWLPGPIRDSFLFGVSADGAAACGISMTGTEAAVRVVRWTEATGLVDLGDVPGGVDYAIGWAVTADGATVVGGARSGSANNDEPFLWSDGAYVLPDLTHGGGGSLWFDSISDDGRVAVGSGPGALIWTSVDGLRSLQDVLETDHGLDLTGWTLSTAQDISADGSTIVGYGLNPGGMLEAWIARLPVPSSVLETSGAGAASLHIVGANPARGTVEMLFELLPSPGTEGTVWQPTTQRSLRVRVIDPAGRVFRSWDQVVEDGRASLHWDGRNEQGKRAPRGRYWIRASGADFATSTSVVMMR